MSGSSKFLNLIFLFILFTSVLSFTFINSAYTISKPTSISNKSNAIYEPITEVLNLGQVGTLATPYIVNLTKDFLFVSRIIWHLHFATNTIDFANFGDDTALTNGVNAVYNGNSLLDNVNITSNGHFAHESYDLTILSDGKNPKNNVLISRLTFSKYVTEGLYINNARKLQFYIQDDITALTSIDQFNVTVQGLKRINKDIIKPFDIFYPNVINKITINELYVGVAYQVRVNTSSGRTNEWINFTATSDILEIQLFLKDLDDDDLVLFIYLYEEGEYIDQISVSIQTQSLEFLGAVFKFIPYAAVLLIITVFIAGIVGETKRRL